MDIIVRGVPHEIDFVRRLCRDKVRRGVLAILPATRPASDDVVVKLRNERDETTKENERLREQLAEFESRLTNVDTSADNVESVPKSSENVPESTGTIDNKGEVSEGNTENVPKSAESSSVEPDSEAPNAMDNKYINDDLQEVDLDADDKTLIEDDSKDVPAVDTKETKTAKKTSKRSKKSE